MNNSNKIATKEEKNKGKNGGWLVTILGMVFRVQGRCPKREISVVFDPQVRKKKIMMSIPIRVQPIGNWGVVT